MLQQDDTFLFLILIVILFFIMLRFIYAKISFPLGKEPVNLNDDIVQLLQQEGYTTLRRKVRIPVHIVRNKQTYDSRYFIDAIAQKDGLYYVVRVSRKNKPLNLSGAHIREHLLPYYLIGKWDGLLYVDQDSQRIHSFMFTIDSPFLKTQRGYVSYILLFLAGFITALIIV